MVVSENKRVKSSAFSWTSAGEIHFLTSGRP